ncbi:glutamine--fructose-6-phosphate transaminase (isomerizing) [Candidatus Pacearchaeota archaeon]|nr:glutamine--fructose-6-phosphate transaminase (isomerizing) [Candidatus Pacearchaeota archaeon]
MCGIIGYWNKELEAFPILLESLKKLEYRGYDSFGFATSFENKLLTERQVGKVSSAKCPILPGKIGIGHTRWATHGKVTEKNTHPHRDCSGKIAVVHNGIIENFQELKNSLLNKNHNFLSETDTEVISHLIEEKLEQGMNLKDAVIEIGSLLKGRNSFVVLNSETKEIIAFRKGSPLIVGITKENGTSEVFIASDIQAFLDKTKKVMYLDDNQIVIIKENPEFYNVKTKDKIEKRLIKIALDTKDAEKGDYSHYMLKEIMEQKETLAKAINQNDKDLMHVSQEINNARGVFFVGCGTAARVCHTAEYIFSKIADKHVNFIPASEFENYKHFLLPETLVIAVSQSGETADVLEALEIAKQRGSKIISIINTQSSSIDKISDYTFLIKAGPEKAVASTKATTSQIVVLILLAYACAGKLKEGERFLIDVAGKVNDMLNPRYEEHIKKLAEIIYQRENIFIIGRGINYPMALESAIKIMEVSYIHAQGFAGGELKHGPIALIEKATPVIVLVANDDVRQEIISNAIEVKSRGAYVIGVSPENNPIFDYWIKTPDVNGEASSIINLVAVQLLAYYLGILRGHDVDYPRSLAKSVTVK